jgi:isopropylmalate/homocitrate/citramalate synthase
VRHRLCFYDYLPPQHQKELDRKIEESGFADYASHREWLKTLGCEISKTQLSIYGKKLKAKVENERILRLFEETYGEQLTPEQLLSVRVARVESIAEGRLRQR